MRRAPAPPLPLSTRARRACIRARGVLGRFAAARWRACAAVCAWVAALYALGARFGVLFICATFFVLALRSARARVDGARGFSGFTVMNAGFRAALGQGTAADWDAAYRGGGVAAPGSDAGGGTRETVAAAIADADAAAAAAVAGTPLGAAAAPAPAGSPAALLSQLAAERAARRAPPPAART